MSVKSFLLGHALQSMGNVTAWPRMYVCDTDAEKPSSGLIVGSLAFAKDSNKIYKATSTTNWTEIGAAGGSVSWGSIAGTLADQTDLNTALSGKAASSHNHAEVYEPAGTVASHVAAADPHTGYQKESERGVANGYASLEADGKVPAAQLPSSGSDPWTYLKLASDFTTSSASAVDVTGLGFTPASNATYEFVGRLMVRTATATVGPRPGVAWATGLSDGVAFIQMTSSATATIYANGNITAAVLAPVGGLPTTTGSWPALIEGMAVAGASPSGTIRVQLASETAGTVVTVKAGSFIKYRTI